MELTVRTYLNDGPGRFDNYEAGDLLREGPTLHFDVPGTAVGWQSVLDLAWAVGNREGQDAGGQRWPSDVRSLSVADVLVVEHTPYAVGRVGFRPIGRQDWRRSITQGVPNERGLSAFASDR